MNELKPLLNLFSKCRFVSPIQDIVKEFLNLAYKKGKKKEKDTHGLRVHVEGSTTQNNLKNGLFFFGQGECPTFLHPSG